MRIIRFELTDQEETMFTSVTSLSDFYGDKPKTFFMRHVMRALDAEKQLVAASAPKPIAQPKPTAEQRKLDERKVRIEQYRAEKLARYRETGIWPRVAMTSDALPGWKKEPRVNLDNGKLCFTDPDRPNGETEGWEPPEEGDYPHMEELNAALKFAERAMANHRAEPVDADAPKLADFADEDGYPDHEAFELADLRYQQAQLREYFAET